MRPRWDPLRYRLERAAELLVQLLRRAAEGRALLAGVHVRGQIKDREKPPARCQRARHSGHVIIPALRRDGAKASVLEHPIERPTHRRWQGKKIALHVAFAADGGMVFRASDGRRRDVEAHHLIRSRRHRPHIVAEATARHQHASVQGAAAEKSDQLRVWRAFFPPRLAGLVEPLPVAHTVRLQMLACATLH